VIKLLKYDDIEVLKDLGIEEKLIGWEKILRDKCTRNELMDVKSINLPDLSVDLKDGEFFIFANILKPGYH
jgi:hypothetical protein